MDAAECRPIIEEFDRPDISRTHIFGCSMPTLHNEGLLIAAPVRTGVGLIATNKEAWKTRILCLTIHDGR